MTTLIPKFQQTNTGAVNRAINLKLAETVSVLDFGADATGATDSTTAFNNAIATGRKVIVPSGTYLVADVTVNSNLDIEGEGTNTTSLVVKTNNSGAFLSASNDVYNIRIASMTIKANTGITGARAYKQVDKSNYTAYCEFIDLNTWADLAIAYDGFFIFTTWTNCIDGYSGSAPGAQTHQAINSNPAAYGQGNQTNLNQVINCEFFSGTDPTGFVSISYGANWLFQSTDFESGTTSAIQAAGIFGITITNCWFENLDTANILYINNSPNPNAQGTRPVLIYNCYCACNANNILFVSANGASSVGINGLALAVIPAAMTLTNATSLTQLAAVEPLSGAGAATFFGGARQSVGLIDISSGTMAAAVVNSPYTQNANILPIGPSGLGAASFTNLSFTSITDTASGIGLATQAVRFDLAGVAQAAYYAMPAKLVAFLQGKTVTLIATGYPSTTAAGDTVATVAWDSVVPNATNYTSVSTVGIATPSSTLQTSYITFTVGAAASSLAVGVRTGGSAAAAVVDIETMTLVLGEIKPIFTGFN